MTKPIGLTIAGSDSIGGAGLQADLKTFEAFDVYGTSVVSLITAQNTQGVEHVEMLSPSLVEGQLRAVCTDVDVAATKTGALGNAGVIERVAAGVHEFGLANLVVDPVMVSKHGHQLIDESAVEAMVESLIPMASVITPNLHEAALLADESIRTAAEMEEAAVALRERFGVSVLITGGSLADADAIDVLADSDGVTRFRSERQQSRSTHGTGCTLSAAIAAGLARGVPLRKAVEMGKDYVDRAMRQAPNIGGGIGPLNHRQ
jgi:hydroxymethylpyrimidine/phosphomethylpyrimidine kinase